MRQEGWILMDLDMTRLASLANCEHGLSDAEYDRFAMAERLRSSIYDWSMRGIVRKNESDSLGVAFAHPHPGVFRQWDDPYAFTWFVSGWGDDRYRYAANAVRKLRPLLRTGIDTLELRLHEPALFQDEVESVVDGRFPWGDFGYGGGTLVRFGGIVLPCAVSGLKQDEDDVLAKFFGGLVSTSLLRERHELLRA